MEAATNSEIAAGDDREHAAPRPSGWSTFAGGSREPALLDDVLLELLVEPADVLARAAAGPRARCRSASRRRGSRRRVSRNSVPSSSGRRPGALEARHLDRVVGLASVGLDRELRSSEQARRARPGTPIRPRDGEVEPGRREGPADWTCPSRTTRAGRRRSGRPAAPGCGSTGRRGRPGRGRSGTRRAAPQPTISDERHRRRRGGRGRRSGGGRSSSCAACSGVAARVDPGHRDQQRAVEVAARAGSGSMSSSKIAWRSLVGQELGARSPGPAYSWTWPWHGSSRRGRTGSPARRRSPRRPTPHWSISARRVLLGLLGASRSTARAGCRRRPRRRSAASMRVDRRLDAASIVAGRNPRPCRRPPGPRPGSGTAARRRARRRRGASEPQDQRNAREPTAARRGRSGGRGQRRQAAAPPTGCARADPADELGRLLVAAEAGHEVGPGDLVADRRRAARRPCSIPASVPAAPAARIRARVASGIVMPGTSLWRNSAWRADTSGSTPSSSGTGNPPGPNRRRASVSIASTWAASYSGWVMTRWAPAASLRSRRSHSVAASAAVGSRAQAIVNDGLLADRRARLVLAAVEPGQDLDQPDRVDVPDAACRSGSRRPAAGRR